MVQKGSHFTFSLTVDPGILAVCAVSSMGVERTVCQFTLQPVPPSTANIVHHNRTIPTAIIGTSASQCICKGGWLSVMMLNKLYFLDSYILDNFNQILHEMDVRLNKSRYFTSKTFQPIGQSSKGRKDKETLGNRIRDFLVQGGML